MEEKNDTTAREQQILEWIRQDPMISQNDLADLAGISRSGVAAHISNLMKKGYIRGKGYIFTPQEHVTVIGGVNMDTYGIGVTSFTAKTSNSGHIYHAVGGLGRNISLNLRKMGIYNYFISMYGDDYDGEQFKIDATNNDMDIAYSKQLMNQKTSSYIYLNQPNGERFIGLDDMKINDQLTPQFLQTRLEAIQSSTSVVVDTNIPEATIKWVTKNYEGPIFAKAVSLTKTERLKSSLSRIDTLVINGVEAPVLSGIEPRDEESAMHCAEAILAKGVKHIFLYVDNLGMLYSDGKQWAFHTEPRTGKKDTNGAGGSAMAALILARNKKSSFDDTSKMATAAAYITSASPNAVNDSMSIESLQEKMKELF